MGKVKDKSRVWGVPNCLDSGTLVQKREHRKQMVWVSVGMERGVETSAGWVIEIKNSVLKMLTSRCIRDMCIRGYVK